MSMFIGIVMTDQWIWDRISWKIPQPRLRRSIMTFTAKSKNDEPGNCAQHWQCGVSLGINSWCIISTKYCRSRKYVTENGNETHVRRVKAEG
jgi:hypothetical protein